MESIEIKPIDSENIKDLNTALEPFPLIGRIIPVFDGAGWSWTEELLAAPGEMCFPPDVTADQAPGYIGSEDKQIFFAYVKGACAGQIIIRKNWNACCFVEDLATAAAHRGQGVARALFAAAEGWARQRKLRGFMLEAQDTNLLACRVYARLGFTLGGVDRQLYQFCAPPANTQLGLFWYRPFAAG